MSPIIYDTNGIVTINSMPYLHSGIPTIVHWKFKKILMYALIILMYAPLLVTYNSPFSLIACISFSFYWPTCFSTIIVVDLIKCVSTEVAESIELTPNQADSAFETIRVTSLVPNQANQGMNEWIGNKMVNSSQSILN